MYNLIIKNKIRKAFGYVNRHEYQKLVPDMHKRVRHSFAGNHALGGIRNDADTLLTWFDRLGIVLPGIQLAITSMYVKGWPHHTTVFVQWEARETLLNGDPYFNRGLHKITIRWGKITELDVYEDSQAVARALDKQFKSGIAEAGAEKIES